MSSKKSSYIKMKNGMGGDALIQFYHYNSDYEKWETKVWKLTKDSTSTDTLEVQFPTGIGNTARDYWAVQVSVYNGSSSTMGIYGSKNNYLVPPYTSWPWGMQECMLESDDGGKTMTFEVTKSTFKINLHSGHCNDDMIRLRDYSPVTNIFVLMLENHSFDNLFGKSGIKGLTVPPPGASNSYNFKPYPFTDGAPFFLASDPGHEFEDVVEQLKGPGGSYDGGSYGDINNEGYVSNYATSNTEGPPAASKNYGDVMKGFTADHLPVTYELVNNYAICDNWFSSLPGPTWPNRYFLHGASSVGMDYSPDSSEITGWESVSGFSYPNGSIFDRLDKNNIPWRIYNDDNNSFTDNKDEGSKYGGFPQVGALEGITYLDYHDVNGMKADLKAPFPYPYTFIEPNYGDVSSGSFKGGSSQHPMDDMYGGEALIKAVYENIRNSPIWASSLLIITYDEHGGFYDSVAPPTTVNPDDIPLPSKYTKHNFNFTQLGVRVPAIIVSPLVKKAHIGNKEYEHSSVIKTILKLTKDSKTDSSPLTDRENYAGSLMDLLTQTPATGHDGTNGPKTLTNPATTTPAPAPEEVSPEEVHSRPIPQTGNLQGFLQIALKFEAEMLNGTPEETEALVKKFKQMKTMGEAHDYLAHVDTLIKKARAKREKEWAENGLEDKGGKEE